MSQVEVKNAKNEAVGKVKLAPFWNEEAHGPLLHRAVVNHLAGKRRGTVGFKDRSEVSGGGKKPFKQKGTGRARQGTSRAPQMKGGGKVFGPMMRDHSRDMNKRDRRKAMTSALALKAAEKKLVVLEALELKGRTREMVELMDRLEVTSALVLLPQVPETVERSARNLNWVKVVGLSGLNTYDLLAYECLVVTKEALAALEGVMTR